MRVRIVEQMRWQVQLTQTVPCSSHKAAALTKIASDMAVVQASLNFAEFPSDAEAFRVSLCLAQRPAHASSSLQSAVSNPLPWLVFLQVCGCSKEGRGKMTSFSKGRKGAIGDYAKSVNSFFDFGAPPQGGDLYLNRLGYHLRSS